MDRHGPLHCTLCRGGECRGGGNKKCVQRDPKISVCAGIIDGYGGLRVVVTHRANLKHHIRSGELCIVARARVHEPIAWGDIPGLIGHVEHCVGQWIDQRGLPNDPQQREAVVMYQLRAKENPAFKRSLDLSGIVET